MARPSEREVEEALAAVRDLVEQWQVFADRNRYVTAEGAAKARAENEKALRVLREAVWLRPVLPSKEAAELLGVDPSNLNDKSVAGLPAPAYVFSRPTKAHPERVMRLWWKDEIEVCARAKRARLGQTREDGAK